MTKNMWREISHGKGRFIAIILIILLGVQIFVGIKAAGPTLNDSADKTVKDAKLSDVQAFSTTGFTHKDVQLAEKVAGAKAELVKFKDVVGGKDQAAVALYGYTKDARFNKLSLRSGHMPRNGHEIVLDELAKDNEGYKLGQTYTFSKSAKIKHRSYKIVGFADSPMYIDDSTRGSADVGDGTVRYFAYIPQREMNLKVATMLNIGFRNLQSKGTFTDGYSDAVNAKVTALKKVFKPRAASRTKALLGNTVVTLDQQLAKITAAKKQLQQAGQQGGSAANLAGQQDVTLTKEAAQLKAAKTKALAAGKTTYTWQDRNDLPGFQAYGESSDRIAAIANVFPVFFFLIAALITFTTITRMVEEARSQIGTFKALGYSKWAIAKNYLAYALTAGLIGTVLGALIGNTTLPRIVLALYKTYIPLKWVVKFQWGDIGWALLFSMIATVGAAAYVVWRELTEGPADLMRPRSPKSAKRIMLERITPLWNRLSFNRKVSYRNLFRFKSRMFMTIIGIAGGTALILTGFGIQDSIGASGTRQYNDIIHYQATMRLRTAGQEDKADQILNNNDQYHSHTDVAANVGDLKANGHQVNDVNIYAPDNVAQFKRYVTVRNANTGKSLSLPKNGVVLTEKTADLLHVKVGDHIKVTTTDNKQGTAKVTGITENYMGHFMYLSRASYKQLLHETPTMNTLLVQFNHQTDKQRKSLAHQLINHGGVMGTSYTKDQQTTVSTMSGSLKPVVAIFILLSGILSFVVLYNLTNINVSERIRELSTIKVLGFYDNEVTMFIVRENIVLTIAGIIVGYGVGELLTGYIMKQAATAQVIFPLTIHLTGFIVATVLMAAFTAIVMFVTHKRLQKIDMVGALSSSE